MNLCKNCWEYLNFESKCVVTGEKIEEEVSCCNDQDPIENQPALNLNNAKE